MALTPQQLADYQRDGYVLVPDIFSSEQMDRALAAAEKIVYGRPFAEWSRIDPPPIIDIAKPQFGRPRLPTGVREIDILLENADYLDDIEQLLETDDLIFINNNLFSRAGPSDKFASPEPWQGFHYDHHTYTQFPPTEPIGKYNYLNSFVFLHDIEPEGAPTVFVPGSHRIMAQSYGEFVREGWLQPYGFFNDIRQVPAFSAGPFVSGTGRKGSVLFYSSYTVHAAIPFKDRSLQRIYWSTTVGKMSNAGHTRYVVPFSPELRQYFVPYWETTTPRVRSLFGWPKPGDPYYTPHSLRNLGAFFPNMELKPYYDALHIDSSR